MNRFVVDFYTQWRARTDWSYVHWTIAILNQVGIFIDYHTLILFIEFSVPVIIKYAKYQTFVILKLIFFLLTVVMVLRHCCLNDDSSWNSQQTPSYIKLSSLFNQPAHVLFQYVFSCAVSRNETVWFFQNLRQKIRLLFLFMIKRNMLHKWEIIAINL